MRVAKGDNRVRVRVKAASRPSRPSRGSILSGVKSVDVAPIVGAIFATMGLETSLK